MKLFFRKSGAKKRGETIIEVLVALLVVTIGSATATSLILTSMRATQFNKDSLVALNLAQEGLEYMRNLRDTNWLKFSGNTQGCWNTIPNSATCDASGGTTALAATDATKAYALGLNASAMTNLTMVAAPLSLSGGVTPSVAPYQLNYYDLSPTVDSDGTNRGIAGLTNLTDDYDYMGSGYTGQTAVNPTRFYRSINVTYFKLDGTTWVASPEGSPTAADMMVITSTVYWLDASTVNKIQLNSALTRYK